MRKREVLGKTMKPSLHKNLRCLKINFYLIDPQVRQVWYSRESFVRKQFWDLPVDNCTVKSIFGLVTLTTYSCSITLSFFSSSIKPRFVYISMNQILFFALFFLSILSRLRVIFKHLVLQCSWISSHWTDPAVLGENKKTPQNMGEPKKLSDSGEELTLTRRHLRLVSFSYRL